MNHTHERQRANIVKLQKILERLAYTKGWAFGLSGGVPECLVIQVECEDSTGRHVYVPGLDRFDIRDYDDKRYVFSDSPFYIRPVFQIPDHDMEYEDLERWLFDRIMDVHRHEAMENFKINGKAVFQPDHDDDSKLFEINRATK